MKIGILTQQLNNNYGGLLQNYALQQVLIKMGHNPITLDWDYPVESVQRLLWKSMLMPIRDLVNGMKKKRTLVAILCAAVLLILTAVSTTTQEREKRIPQIRARGVLLVGTTGDYRPITYLDPGSGEYWGFDIELAKDLAEALGVELRFVPTTWPTLMEDTQAEKFDLAISGITITDARRAQALMSEGYLANGKTVLCRAADAGRYTSLEAIDGM